MAKIILVEDDLSIARAIVAWLEKEKHVVESTVSGKEGLDLLLHFHFDLAILDWQLPDISGLEIAKSLQERDSRVPVLMLTSKGMIQDKLAGLGAGAFDYVVKPCPMEELSARVRALLRRPAEIIPNRTIIVGNLSIETASREVKVGNQIIGLSPSEYEILKFFATNPDSHFTVEAIFTRLWFGKPNASKQIIKVHVNHLRNKLKDSAATVQVLTDDLKQYYLSTDSAEP